MKQKRTAREFSHSEIFIGFVLLADIFNDFEHIQNIIDIVQELILIEDITFTGSQRSQLFTGNSAAVLAYRHLKEVAATTQKRIDNQKFFTSIDPPNTSYDAAPSKGERIPQSPAPGRYLVDRPVQHFSSFTEKTQPVVFDDKSFLRHIELICLLREEKHLPLLSCFEQEALEKVKKIINIPEQIQKSKADFAKPIISYLGGSEKDSDSVKNLIRALKYFFTKITEFNEQTLSTKEITNVAQWFLLQIRLIRYLSQFKEGNIPKELSELMNILNKHSKLCTLPDIKQGQQYASQFKLGVIPTLTDSTIALIQYITALPSHLDRLEILKKEKITLKIERIKLKGSINALKSQDSEYKYKISDQHMEKTEFTKALEDAIVREKKALIYCSDKLNQVKDDQKQLKNKLKSPLQLLDKVSYSQPNNKEQKQISTAPSLLVTTPLTTPAPPAISSPASQLSSPPPQTPLTPVNTSISAAAQSSSPAETLPFSRKLSLFQSAFSQSSLTPKTPSAPSTPQNQGNISAIQKSLNLTFSVPGNLSTTSSQSNKKDDTQSTQCHFS